MKYRLPIAAFFAFLVTFVIFLFMQHLIHGQSKPLQSVEISSVVELHHPQKKQQPVPPSAAEPQAPTQEPSMDELTVDTPQMAPATIKAIALPEFDSLEFPTSSGWSVAVGEEDAGLLRQLGEDSKGYIEVTATATRQPNVPELAWKKKVNGWVLVAFKVGPDGVPKDIRVLDASPPGIFEEKVIAAISDWRYVIRGQRTQHANKQGDLIMTQKIELFWKDYPYNVDWLD
jgi:protein TonB